MKNARRMYINAVAERTKHLNAAEAALAANDLAEYESELAAAQAMDADIERLQTLIDEQDRFISGGEIPAQTTTAAAIPADVENLVAQLHKGEKITLPQDLVLATIREAVNSVLIGTDTLAKPTGVGTRIRDNQDTVSGVLSMVTVEDLSGCQEWQEPYVKENSTAKVGADGTAPTESNPTFRVAAVKPVLVDTIAYVSRHIANLTPVAYYEKVKSLALNALREKIVELMTKGDGNTFYGFANAKNTKGEFIAKTLTVNSVAVDEKFLRNLVLRSGGKNTTGHGVLQLTKDDLVAFGDVRGSDKKPVYEIVPDASTSGNTGFIKDGGLSVPYVVNSYLTALSTATQGATAQPTMIYGDLSAYMLGLFGNYSVLVDSSYKFAEKLLSVMGEVMAGGNLCAHEALTVVTLAAKAS